ncbi:hypothetical protein BSL78_16127 [Apostichopus japonicus]|uniref:Uncharacterized protein n=1 Tax=Stichopus japonicus TaxID=307972 RepID=A0A2G8KG74_STIJA|nr:hypothetical protein BSL78_16127 [Apostichopus japonicus]
MRGRMKSLRRCVGALKAPTGACFKMTTPTIGLQLSVNILTFVLNPLFQLQQDGYSRTVNRGLSKDLKVLMKQKHVAYHNKDYETARTRQREIKREIKRCQYQYGKKLERKFQCNDSRAAWKVMSTITGHKLKKSDTAHATMDFINELNQFYCRFDEIDFNEEQLSLRAILFDKCNDLNRVILSVDEVRTLFSRVNVIKLADRIVLVTK